MDRAGNQSAVATASYTVDTVLPVITVISMMPANLTFSTSLISFNYKTNVKGTATLRLGGTNCSGTVLATTAIGSINPMTLRAITIPAATVAANLAVGANDIQLCVANTAGLVGSTTRTFVRDITAPGITSITTPSGTVDPNNITFLINFDEPMRPSACPLDLTVQGAANTGCPAIGTWITSQSLQLKVFPVENAQISWSISGLTDLAGNLVAPPAPGSFKTGMQSKRRFPVTETQQSLCYDNSGGTIGCAGTGQNGLVPAAPTSMLLTGPFAPNASYPTQAVVTDNRTGLMWMVCPTTQTWNGTACTGLIASGTWDTASLWSINNWNLNDGYAGFRDWRLPTATELATIKIYASTSLPPAYFPGAAARVAWTSTGNGASSVYTTTLLNTLSGPDTQLESPSNPRGIALLVRDPSPGTVPASFTDNGDGTLWDAMNQLTWEKCSAGQPSDCSGAPNLMNFAAAVSYCDGRGTGWRIPTIKELKSIVDYGAASAPYVYGVFSGTSGTYWSSTAEQTYTPAPTQHTLVTSNGTTTGMRRDGGNGNIAVRCVKGP